MIASDLIRSYIAAAALAPSVHNVQPARWRVEPDGATLFEDVRRRLAVADPAGHDASISLGAAAEGFRLAATRDGMKTVVEPVRQNGPAGYLRPVVRLCLVAGAKPDPLADLVATRQSWRGPFCRPTDADRRDAAALGADDAVVITEPEALARIAGRLDAASWRFMANRAFRGELLSWMRLSRTDANWARDGLNADAMAMGVIEAHGARFVLGPAFGALERIGLARPLLSEAGKMRRDTAVVLFTRPAGEQPFDSGAAFYRAWLAIEAAGFGASVLAALADDPETARWIGEIAEMEQGRRVVSAFRIGRRPDGPRAARARLPLEELLVQSGQSVSRSD